MIQHLPAKNFRMVRYYGIYARTVRNKVHALVADVRRRLQQGLDHWYLHKSETKRVSTRFLSGAGATAPTSCP